MKSAVLRKRFTHTAVADILRAAAGGASPASATLALCTLDYLAYLRNRAGGNSENYQRIVEDFLVPINSLYRPGEIYAWRCAMVHTYAESDAMLAANLDGYLMRHHAPDFHLSSWHRERFQSTSTRSLPMSSGLCIGSLWISTATTMSNRALRGY